MSTTVDEDFRAFVVARWSDLEAVAMVVVLDGDLARRTTTDALAGLSRQWREAVEDGRPGEQARRAVLTSAVAAARGGRQRGSGGRRPGAVEPAPVRDPFADSGDPRGAGHDEVVLALLRPLAEADPLDRALVAARYLWDCGPGEVAALLALPPAELARRDTALHDRLRAAHESARVAAGFDGGGWFERDLDDALTALLRGQGDPPDPAGLVARRSGTVRRRQLVIGGAAAVATAGLATAVALREEPPPAPARPKAPPGPTDPTWSRTATWSARGPLADDPRTRALVSSIGPFGSRILWAGDLGTRRLVIASYPGQVDMDGTELVVWSGARGQDIRSLQTANLALSGLYGVDDLVAVSMPDGAADAPTSLLVVLTPPVVTSAEYSRYVLPLPSGNVDRDWTRVALENGVAAVVLDSPQSHALRVRANGVEQPPAGTLGPFADLDQGDLTGPSLLAGTQALVAAVTGVPERRLGGDVVLDEVLGEYAFDVGSDRSRVVVIHTTLPNGAVLTTAAVRDVSDGALAPGRSMLLRSAALTPLDHLADPVVTRLEDERVGVGRFLVVVPGAARVQLISSSPDGYPVSKVVRTGGRNAVVVPMVNADLASAIRVIARDASGRALFDDVPYEPLWLLGF
ncbi:hypothetical protein [Oryzobacter telluris]|uniref:hypothetical protein n=1 Tax=Oryzobacter telluris TaxID=3149179 RepID=UPI00370DD6CE